jgi:hypothetical protein
MPYVRCARCGTLAFSTGYWSGVDTCPRCEAPLRRKARPADAAHRRPPIDFDRAVRERLRGLR